MNPKIQEYIGNEKNDLDRLKADLKRLKIKLFKFFGEGEQIKFLEKYLKEKEKLIKKMQGMA